MEPAVTSYFGEVGDGDPIGAETKEVQENETNEEL
jgi:hypothetical protein